MKRDDRPGPITSDSQNVPQFAPGFSVYVLPPDTVCLYSEHRKFFLHGALYRALAEAIGAGSSYRDIERVLGKDYPSATIHEALKRLVDRRFVIPSAGPAEPTVEEAYWSSLGLPPAVASANLRKLRVRVHAIEVQGESELSAALKRLGVRIVKRGGDLTVVLVNDYLDNRLSEINLKYLTDVTPWVLAQPSGVFPLVGPIFWPGQTACWTCLAERMRRNREIKAFLNRQNALCVSTSPLANNVFGQTAIQMTAIEIAKAIATDFRTDLRDHLISLDLLGSTVARHYVAARPQCPECGREELRDPGRAAVPIELKAGGKLVMTSGGFRAVSSAATVRRYRKFVSPLTGVVSRLERIDVDLPMNTNFFATHNFASRPGSVAELKAGLSGGSYGKGSTAEQGEASALMESIERYSGVFQGDEIRATRRFSDFPPGDAILPNDVLLYSKSQISRDQSGPDAAAGIEWSPVWSLRNNRFKYLPTSILYFSYRDAADVDRAAADSNGCAAGNTIEEAIVQGFLELVERDAYAIWWYNRVPRPEVDLGRFDDPYIRELEFQFAATGKRIWLLDVTNDLGIPCFIAAAHWIENSHEQIEFGSGAHFDARIAALRALTELNQFLSIGLMGDQQPLAPALHSEGPPFRLQDSPYLVPDGKPVVRPDFSSSFGHLDKRDQVLECVRIAEQAGHDFLVLDQTRPDIGVPVVRVIVPGLRHFYRRFAPGRLYDVPVKLGWRKRPLQEAELNPLLPRT